MGLFICQARPSLLLLRDRGRDKVLRVREKATLLARSGAGSHAESVNVVVSDLGAGPGGLLSGERGISRSPTGGTTPRSPPWMADRRDRPRGWKATLSQARGRVARADPVRSRYTDDPDRRRDGLQGVSITRGHRRDRREQIPHEFGHRMSRFSYPNRPAQGQARSYLFPPIVLPVPKHEGIMRTFHPDRVHQEQRQPADLARHRDHGRRRGPRRRRRFIHIAMTT